MRSCQTLVEAKDAFYGYLEQSGSALGALSRSSLRTVLSFRFFVLRRSIVCRFLEEVLLFKAFVEGLVDFTRSKKANLGHQNSLNFSDWQ